MRTAIGFFLAITAASSVSAQHSQWLPPRPPYADSLPDAARAPLARTVAQAEREGATWPRRSEVSSQPNQDARNHWATPAPRTCATATSIGPLRSGEFVIGGNIGGSEAWHGEVKIWWEPMHPAESFSLVVRGVSLTTPGDTLRYTSTNWVIGGRPPADWSGPVFFASGLVIPSTGRWLVIATSGPDWGCFILTSA